MNLPALPPSQQKVTTGIALRSSMSLCWAIFKVFIKDKGRQKKSRSQDRRNGRDLRKQSLRTMLSFELRRLKRNLASARLDRNEWDLAIPPLERALKTSSRLASADDAVRLNDMLQKARVKAQNMGQEAPITSGEITNSIGMRLVTIRPGAFVMGSTPAETRRIQAEWNVPETMRTGRKPCS